MVDACPACFVKYYIQGSTLGAEKLVVCTVFFLMVESCAACVSNFFSRPEHFILHFNIYRVYIALHYSVLSSGG